MPVGEGIIGRAAASGQPVRSDDLRADPRSAQRDVDEKEGMRSMLSVPLRVAGEIIGVISAFSTTPGFFTDRHPMLLEAFADQAGAAIQNARLFEESQRRARETQALLEAGRAVNQSLDVEETIRLILTQAREVLGVESCGLMTLDARPASCPRWRASTSTPRAWPASAFGSARVSRGSRSRSGGPSRAPTFRMTRAPGIRSSTRTARCARCSPRP